MSNLLNGHSLGWIIDPKEDPELPDAKAKNARGTDYALDTGRTRLRGERIDSVDEALLNGRRQAIEFLQGSRQDLNGVRQGAVSQVKQRLGDVPGNRLLIGIGRSLLNLFQIEPI